MYLSNRISVVIPAYNEETLILNTLDSIPDYIDAIMVVDDCSTDGTIEKIAEFEDDRLVLIKHEVNRGVGAAIVSGYKESIKQDIDISIVMAGDNQMDSQYIPNLLKPIINEGIDYTKGNRLVNERYMVGMSAWRKFGNKLLSILNKISTGYWDICDPQNGYTAISKRCIEKIDLDSIFPRYGYCNDMLSKMNVQNCKIKDVPIPARYGNEKSKIVYHKYIFSLSILLTRCFVWRVSKKYLNIR